MGIPGLWKLLSGIRKDQSLTELAVREGFEIRRHGSGALIVGIDASPWMYAAQASMDYARRKGASRAALGKNSELRLLFDRMSEIGRLPINAVFVFDGPKRPSEKRSTAVGAADHYMTQDFKMIIKGFGHSFHDAPAEAEAELAYLDSIGAVDMVWTSDSDIFLFGGQHVIRHPQDSDNRDSVEVYIFKTPGDDAAAQVLDRAGVLFLAVVVGGDYNPQGLLGCGMKKALALLSTDLAHSLYDATVTLSKTRLAVFLTSWREELRNALALNLNNVLGACYPSLAAKISEDFPDPDVLRLYAHPITSDTEKNYSPKTAEWVSKLPDTAALTTLCQQLFGWVDVLDKFSRRVWDGQCIKELALAHCRPPTTRNTGLGPNSIRHIHASAIRIDSPSAFASYHVEVWIPSVVATALFTGGTSRGAATHESTYAWVPGPILRSVLPELVEDYHRITRKPKLDKLEPYVSVLDGPQSMQRESVAIVDIDLTYSDEEGDVDLTGSDADEGHLVNGSDEEGIIEIDDSSSDGDGEVEIIEIDSSENEVGGSAQGPEVIDLTGDDV